ncbi:hypothetical protein BX661DRAFT_180987, partial [Kickxella alabastrina]|uniref:uncharacterized protein n=1 Tax=Kickxella alabastrina TaxID=61397 RepID=UPI002221109E
MKTEQNPLWGSNDDSKPHPIGKVVSYMVFSSAAPPPPRHFLAPLMPWQPFSPNLLEL